MRDFTNLRTTSLLGALGFTWTVPGAAEVTSMLQHGFEVGFLPHPSK